MKRIKNLFIIATIFVLSLVVNVNADTCPGSDQPIYKGSSYLSPGDEILLHDEHCIFEAEEEYIFNYDSNVFTIVSEEPLVDTGCYSIKDVKYFNSPGEFKTVYTHGERNEKCVGTGATTVTLEYRLRVNDVESQNTTVLGQIFEIENPNKPNVFKSAINYLKSLRVEGLSDNSELNYGQSGFGFQKGISGYYSYVDYETDSVKVFAEAEDEKAVVLGAGEHQIITGNNSITIVVIAENGDFREYSILLYKKNADGFLSTDLDVVNSIAPAEEEINNAKRSVGLESKDEVTNPFNLYLFYGEGCPHCADLEKFLDSIDDEYGKYYNLVKYEVWYNESNSKLFSEVLKRMNTSTEKIGVPYLVIGDSSIMGYGNTEEENEEIINTIMRVYNSSTRYDVIKDETISTEEEKNELVEEPKDDSVKELKKLKTYLEIVSGCCILVIVLFIGFIIVNNRKKNDEEKSE